MEDSNQPAGACPLRHAAVLAWIACCCAVATAGPVYESTAPDGHARFADQPLDASYRPLRTAGAVPAPLHPADAEEGLVRGVIAVESAGRADAVSSRGARGLMQIMPATARGYGVSAKDLDDPRRNVAVGRRHLEELLRRHDGNVVLALAAYNAGAGAVARHGLRIPPYRETMLYIPAVLVRAGWQP